MARIRSTFPGQWTDEDFVECQPLARLLAIALRNEADDQGVFEWKPTGLKMRLMPADNVDMNDLLRDLEDHRQVRRFEVNGKIYGAIRNFMKWQNPKKPKPVHPLPDELREWVGAGAKRGKGSEPDDGDDQDGPEHGGDDGGGGSELTPPSSMPSSELGRTSRGRSSELTVLQVVPVPQKSELAPQREEGGGKREKESPPPPRSRTAPRGSGGVVAGPVRPPPDDPKRVVARAFVAIRDELWPDEPGRPAAAMTLETEAGQWLATGGTVDVIVATLRAQMTGAREAGKAPPTSLKAYRLSLQDAVATARAAAERAGRVELLAEDPERAKWRGILERYRKTGNWFDCWGAKPGAMPRAGEAPCQAPRDLVESILGAETEPTS